MRIKKACQVTGLTERAVRLYVKKGLLRPAVREGLLDFSAEDVHRLRDIALLRYMGFTLEQIGTMAADDGAVPSVAIQRRETARAEALQSGEAARLLSDLPAKATTSLAALVEALRQQARPICEPDFSRLDDGTPLGEEARFYPWRRWLALLAGLFLLLALSAGAWLNIPRLQGFLPIGPLTVTAVTEELVTVALEDEEIIALLGRTTLTAPYAIQGRSLLPGERIPHGVQLVLRLTNLELLRMGISPLADLSTAYPAVNDAWLQTIFHEMREEEWRRCGQLVFFDYPNVGPLQWWKG